MAMLATPEDASDSSPGMTPSCQRRAGRRRGLILSPEASPAGLHSATPPSAHAAYKHLPQPVTSTAQPFTAVTPSATSPSPTHYLQSTARRSTKHRQRCLVSPSDTSSSDDDSPDCIPPRPFTLPSTPPTASPSTPTPTSPVPGPSPIAVHHRHEAIASHPASLAHATSSPPTTSQPNSSDSSPDLTATQRRRRPRPGRHARLLMSDSDTTPPPSAAPASCHTILLASDSDASPSSTTTPASQPSHRQLDNQQQHQHQHQHTHRGPSWAAGPGPGSAAATRTGTNRRLPQPAQRHAPSPSTPQTPSATTASPLVLDLTASPSDDDDESGGDETGVTSLLQRLTLVLGTPQQQAPPAGRHQGPAPSLPTGSGPRTSSRPTQPPAASPPSTPTPLSVPPTKRKEAQPKTPRQTPQQTPGSRAFMREREAVARSLYSQWNLAVFGCLLPEDLPITWNPRLLSTAGQCVDDGSKNHLKSRRNEKIATRIELSAKVIDSLDRLRQTLAHEMCHVAAWHIEADYGQPHGSGFKRWARLFMASERGLNITRCHNYTTFMPFRWQCSTEGCKQVYSRCSKSIDPTKQVCSRCHGRLAFLGKFNREGNLVRERGPTEYSLFVKQAFPDVKASLPPGTPNSVVLKAVSSRWQAAKSQQKGTPASTAGRAAGGLGVDIDGEAGAAKRQLFAGADLGGVEGL